MVERNLAKVEVAGSTPVIRSKKSSKSKDLEFFYLIRRIGVVSPARGHGITAEDSPIAKDPAFRECLALLKNAE